MKKLAIFTMFILTGFAAAYFEGMEVAYCNATASLCSTAICAATSPPGGSVVCSSQPDFVACSAFNAAGEMVSYEDGMCSDCI